MNTTEKWNYIVSRHSKLYNAQEKEIQSEWNQVRPEDIWGIDNNKAAGRFEFVGEVADDSIREKFINKTIPFKYRKPGMASPVIFSK